MASAIPPGYLSRHSTRILQPPFYPASIPPGCLTAAIPPGYFSRHSIRPAFLPDVSQPPFHPDTTVAILSGRRSTFSGYFSRLSTRPISLPPLYSAYLTAAILPGQSHSRHSTQPISQPPFYPSDVPPSPDISHPAPSAGWERRVSLANDSRSTQIAWLIEAFDS